jgi:hypothetical protein
MDDDVIDDIAPPTPPPVRGSRLQSISATALSPLSLAIGHPSMVTGRSLTAGLSMSASLAFPVEPLLKHIFATPSPLLPLNLQYLIRQIQY